ncbi:GNAT family protein [Streptomyces sp. NPDC051940]|uniref:GNAT family N-acetyltransferase n=1 Tax=Streptomyces sp. NPDC051940 TaxID=3155675 RepID=UPI00342F42E1
MLIDHWPLLGLRLRTARLELRLPGEGDLAALADLAAQGVHAPDERPFLTPWTEGTPAEVARRVVQGHWGRLGDWQPDGWSLGLAAFLDGEAVGVQGIRARDFGVRREVTTSSWLGLAYHGRGLGTESRHAALALVFAGLGGVSATTEAFEDNHASMGVSRKLGYRPDGISRDVLDGKVVVSRRLRLSREDWERSDRPPVEIEGVDRCLELFGAAE